MILLCVLCVLCVLNSCTSIHWSGSDGAQHHLGLFAYQVVKHDHGHTLKKQSLGVDLSLTEPDAGYFIGYRDTATASPEVRTMAGNSLTEDVYRALTAGTRAAPSQVVDWGFLYLKEYISSCATVITSDTIGIALATRLDQGLYVGYRGMHHATGEALCDDTVHVHVRDREDPSRQAFILWKLRKDRTP